MKQIFILMAAVATFLLTACDVHRDFPDTSLKTCHILCTDGQTMPYEEYAQSKKEAIAVVFHINNGEEKPGNGYAVYLWDVTAQAFADSIGVVQGTSTDRNAFVGNSNTFALYSKEEVKSPIAESVFDIWWYGQSAYIPSVAEMRLLFQAKETINPLIKKCGGDPLPDHPDQCWYWTSTEVEGQAAAKSWLYSMGSGAIQETPKWQAHKVRPIITLNE